MKWSKLRKELKERLADHLKARLDYHLTTYKNSLGFMGRAWVTWDGEEILNFSNQDTWITHDAYSNGLAETGYWPFTFDESEGRTMGRIMERGEFSKYDFAENAYRFLSLDIQEAAHSDNPMLRFFAVVDCRIGKRTLEAMRASEQHPMIQFMIKLRVGE